MITTPSTPAEAISLAALGNRVLATAGQSDMVWGHASVRDPEGRGVWMKSSGWGFEEIGENRVVLVSPDGKVLHGEGRRHTVAKRAVVWADSQFLAGWEYWVRLTGPAEG